jgi:hypothetical protein
MPGHARRHFHRAVDLWRSPPYGRSDRTVRDLPRPCVRQSERTRSLRGHGSARGTRVGIDAGLASCDDAGRLIALSHPPTLHRILIEIDLTDFDSARIETEAILCLIGDRFSVPVLLHGEQEPIVWPMVALAARSGHETRIVSRTASVCRTARSRPTMQHLSQRHEPLSPGKHADRTSRDGRYSHSESKPRRSA